jgi:hypothetical protein
MTVSVRPRELRPAVRAKGTVKPSEKPRVKSERNRMRIGLLDFVMIVALGYRDWWRGRQVVG